MAVVCYNRKQKQSLIFHIVTYQATAESNARVKETKVRNGKPKDMSRQNA